MFCDDASTQCEAMGGYPVSVQTEEEKKYIHGHLTSKGEVS